MDEKIKARRKGPHAERPGQIIRLTGRRFGKLMVIQRAGRRGRFITWLCRCDCGTEVEVPGAKLRNGKRTQCSYAKHAPDRPTPLYVQYKSEYQSWESMRARCLSLKHKNYPRYGGRGIKICPEWESFEVFLRDMGRKPDPKFTIEREDVDGDYTPANCRWIRRADQNRNRRNSVFVTYQGKRVLLIDLVADLGLSRTIVYGRLKNGWTLAQALSIVVRPYRKRVAKPGKPRKVRTLRSYLPPEPLHTLDPNYQIDNPETKV